MGILTSHILGSARPLAGLYASSPSSLFEASDAGPELSSLTSAGVYLKLAAPSNLSGLPSAIYRVPWVRR